MSVRALGFGQQSVKISHGYSLLEIVEGMNVSRSQGS
jgi:hypothetical protein